MPAFTGKDLVVKWIYTSGTLVMNTDYQDFLYTPTVDFLESTAGADISKTRLPTEKDGTASFKGLIQAGDLPAWGTALALGMAGTILYYPEGTAAGKYAGTVPALSQGLAHHFVYNALVEANVSWLQNGDESHGVN
jgi:hypothetical protein